LRIDPRPVQQVAGKFPHRIVALSVNDRTPAFVEVDVLAAALSHGRSASANRRSPPQ
jgi:hypothetical protein